MEPKHKPCCLPLLTQFHRIENDSVTFTSLVLKHNNLSQSKWCQIMYHYADALLYIHSRNFLHNDLKGGNVIISGNKNNFFLLIIDSGKSTETSKGNFYKLSLRDQDKYRNRKAIKCRI